MAQLYKILDTHFQQFGMLAIFLNPYSLSQMKRQQRKLNFLITQTELYAHFMAKKLTGGAEHEKERILSRLNEVEMGSKTAEVSGGSLTNVGKDNYSPDDAKFKALKTAETAFRKHRNKVCVGKIGR